MQRSSPNTVNHYNSSSLSGLGEGEGGWYSDTAVTMEMMPKSTGIRPAASHSNTHTHTPSANQWHHRLSEVCVKKQRWKYVAMHNEVKKLCRIYFETIFNQDLNLIECNKNTTRLKLYFLAKHIPIFCFNNFKKHFLQCMYSVQSTIC